MPLKKRVRTPWIYFFVWVLTTNTISTSLPASVARPHCGASLAERAKTSRGMRAMATLAALLILPAARTAQAGLMLPGQEAPPPAVAVAIAPLADPAETFPETRYVIRRYVDHFRRPKEGSLLAVEGKANPAFRSFAVDALGGERDVQVTRTTPQGGLESEIVIAPKTTDLEHRQNANATGTTLVVWDGEDANPSIAYQGLGAENLRHESVDSFVIAISSATQPGQITLRVYDAADPQGKIVSTATVSFNKTEVRPAPQNEPELPGKTHDQVYRVYFDNFVPGPNGGVNFSRVGAISLLIQHDTPEAGKVALDFVALAGPLACPGTWTGNFSAATYGGNVGTNWISPTNDLSHSSSVTPLWAGIFSPFYSPADPPPLIPLPPGGFPDYCPGGRPPCEPGGPGGHCPPDGPPTPHPSVPEPGTLTLILSAMATAGGYRVVRLIKAHP